MKKSVLKGVIATSAVTLLLGLTGETYAHANELASQQNQQEKPSQSQINTESVNLEEGINSYLGLIEKMPESVTDQGINSGVTWLNKNKTEDYEGYKFIAKNGNIQLVKDTKGVVTYGAGACAAAVGAAIAQNAIPWAKILKVKKAAKAVGGIQKLSGKISTAYKHQRNLGKSKSAALKSGTKVAMKAFPETTRNAVIEFFSLGAVGSACFGW